MLTELKFRTFEKQRIAFRYLRDKKTNEVLYGGGARGGKSWLGCGWVLIECIQKPGSQWMIAREEMTKLKDTTLLTFFMVVKELGLQQRIHFNAQSLIVTLDNGSLIFFREIKYLPSDPEFDRLGSYDLTGCFLDECQQIHEKAINVLRGRFSLLSGEGWETIPKSLYTCNPSKNWIYSSFIRPEREGRLNGGKVFVKSLATDNPFIGQDYLDNLKKSDKVTVQRLLYGNFEYDDDPSVLIEYEKILDCFTNTWIAVSGRPHITCDVARFGTDKTVIGIWNGWGVRLFAFHGLSVSQTAEKIKGFQTRFQVGNSDTIADEDGVGGGVVDILRCRGFVNNSRPVEVPGKEAENFANLKSQCYFHLSERINNGGVYIECNDPEMKAAIIEELEQVKQYNMDKDSKRAVLPKDKVKELIGRSPDFADTIMMREWFELMPRFAVAAW